MSLIGPRPDPPDWLNRYPEDVKVFLTVKPGLTGYNQAYYRNSADAEEKMRKWVQKKQRPFIPCRYIADIVEKN